MGKMSTDVVEEGKGNDKSDEFDFIIEEEDANSNNSDSNDSDVGTEMSDLSKCKKNQKNNLIAANTKKTSQRGRKKKNLTVENKIKILQYLKEHGTTMKTVRDVIAKFKLPESLVLEYVKQQMQIGQRKAAEECKNESFINANLWIKTYENYQVSSHTDFELAYLYNNIADTEEHPDPAELDGIDLKKAYKFLANALEGNPQIPPDGPTSEFLKQQLKKLEETSVEEEAQTQTNNIKLMLGNKHQQEGTNKRSKISLDPLNYIPSIEGHI
ncbi:uncharacterized protein LOC119674008 [Teleopsis dalmanni]|uniref:uncharacterized protein LOC119674008 n=1 Tax=Teleopsis dalmanni TaxID=139649 RepID=UPI0018CF0CD0|nr:uncharacterized protein LOC119674008 [Teleopsis dalmanni]